LNEPRNETRPHAMRKQLTLLAAALAATALASCKPVAQATAAETAGEAAISVQRANAAVAKAIDLSDPASFADARRGFIAAPEGQIRDADGHVIWDFAAFAFVKGDAPATVNPSLWRQALLNNQVGLFEVTEHIWQLRGFDLANITLSAVIFTHSHIDHFGGVLGIISAEDAKARNVPIIAPAGFMEEAT